MAGKTKISELRQFTLATLLFPFGLYAIDDLQGHTMFAGSCADPVFRDYVALAFDAVVKGVFIDVLESFQVNLYTCKAAKTYANGAALLLIRSYSTYVLIWAVVSWVKSRYRHEEPRA